MAVEAEGAAGDADPAGDALEHVAAAANQVADDQRRIARATRTLARRHRQGRAWTQLLEDGTAAGLLRLGRHSATLLSSAARGSRPAWSGRWPLRSSAPARLEAVSG